jgi:hypothetical protein
MHVLSSLSIGFSRRPINIVRNQGHLAYNNNGGAHSLSQVEAVPFNVKFSSHKT